MDGINIKTNNYEILIKNIIKIIAICLTLFHLYTAGTTPYTPVVQRAVHLGLALGMVFFVHPTKTRSGRKLAIIDIMLFLMAVSSSFYIIKNYHAIAFRAGFVTTTDIVFGIFMILCLLEGTRRALGPAMPIIGIIFLLYTYFGYIVPGAAGHSGFSLARIINTMYISTEGIFTTPLGVSATYVGMFVTFGVFLQRTGGGDFIFRLANAVLGHVVGGPAKVAVVSSGFLGMMTGSVVANVVTSGNFTIPMMKKVGFDKNFAGGVEAAASTGGLIMPPVMGAAAFIIAEILGISYWNVALAAFAPAFLYYISLFLAVDLRARKLKIKPMAKTERESILKVLRDGWYYIVPVVVLVLLIAMHLASVLKAGFYATVILILLVAIFNRSAISINNLIDILAESGRSLITVAMACACAGIIVGAFTLTGLGLKLSTLLLALSGGNLLALLFLTMICCLILGMGVSPTAAYIVLAILVAPALIQLGVIPLAAHLFIFYFAIYANVTPPVAVGSYAAAAISGGNSSLTAVQGFRLALPGILIPFVFAYNPSILLVGGFMEVFIGILSTFLGVLLLTIALEGYIKGQVPMFLRITLFIGALLLIIPGYITDIVGFIMAIGVFCLQFVFTKKTEERVVS